MFDDRSGRETAILQPHWPLWEEPEGPTIATEDPDVEEWTEDEELTALSLQDARKSGEEGEGGEEEEFEDEEFDDEEEEDADEEFDDDFEEDEFDDEEEDGDEDEFEEEEEEL